MTRYTLKMKVLEINTNFCVLMISRKKTHSPHLSGWKISQK